MGTFSYNIYIVVVVFNREYSKSNKTDWCLPITIVHWCLKSFRSKFAIPIEAPILWLQETVQSSCWSSMFNGIWPVPTKKQFNSAYFQNKVLISRKIHRNIFWLEILFLHVDHKSPWCCRKNFFFNKKIGIRFSIGDPPPQARQVKKARKKSLRLHTRGSPAVAAEAV